MLSQALRPVLLRASWLVAATALLVLPAHAAEVFGLPPKADGGVNASSWVDPDGSDSDTYSWEDFTLAETQTITEVRWRGGYALGAPYGHAFDFRISFFDSNITGNEPLIVALPEHESQEIVIATFHTNDDAGETFAGVSGGVTMYDYHYTLPTPVTLQGGVKYWFRVVAAQSTYPDWGMATATGGNSNHFRFNTGSSMFQNWPNDLSFSLHATWADLGAGLAGSAGVPGLSGTGTLAPGSPCSFVLTSALPSSTVWFVLGLSRIDAPFKGGVFVPLPQIIVPVPTDPTGAVTLPFSGPTGVPSGVELLAQGWIIDPAGVFGFASTNGLSATVP